MGSQSLLSARANASDVMKEGGRGNSSRLTNIITRVLVVGQIALTAALLIAATLQVKSIRNQTTLNYGYDENGVYTARMALFEGDYPSSEARSAFFAKTLRALRADPAFEGYARPPALHWAAFSGNHALVQLLLERGADPQRVDPPFRSAFLGRAPRRFPYPRAARSCDATVPCVRSAPRR